MRVKIIQSAILLLLVMIPYCSMGSLMSFVTIPIEDSQDTINASDTNEIRLRYYVRKFYVHSCSGSSVTLQLSILVEVSNDVDCVIMMCTPEVDPSYNVTMNETSTENLYETSLQFALPVNSTLDGYSGIIVRYDVQYFVNTTTGLSITSEFCPYQVKLGGLHGDGVTIAFYTTPDLWYEEGTTGHEVTWAVSTGGPTFYKLTEDGFLIDAWSWSGPLTINVDDLGIGDHVYRLGVSTGGTAHASETVTVHVVTTIPPGVSTGSVGPITDFVANANNLPQILLGTAIGVCLIVVVFIVYRTKFKS